MQENEKQHLSSWTILCSAKKHVDKKGTKTVKLKLQLKQAKEVLNGLRVYIRVNKFIEAKEEIHFFKYTKPNI